MLVQFSASVLMEVEVVVVGVGVGEVVVPLPPGTSNQLKLNPSEADDCILMV
jgi:hypothetical protein